MKEETKKLKSFLLDLDSITERELEIAEKKADQEDKKLETVLIEEGLIKRERLARIKAYVSGIPSISLEGLKIPPEVLKKIPEKIARTNNIIAFKKEEDNLEVAMTDPEDLNAIEIVKKTTGLNVLPRLTTYTDIKKVLEQYRESLESEFGKLLEKDFENREIVNEAVERAGEDLEEIAEDMPVVKIVDMLIKHAIFQRASDIHIEPQEKKITIRYRVDGILREVMTLPKEIAPGIVARIKILSSLKLDEHRLPQDGRFKIEEEDYKYSLRVSVMPVSNGEKVVLRLLSETEEAMSLQEIGLGKEMLEKVSDALEKMSGMILVTGPTGSGKTTTLYSLLKKINTSRINISTVEDPIEYQIPKINQTQVNPKIGFTFAKGLRSLLRQDPNVIMVGEIRDGETAKLATNAALTGHLVLSTLHTTDSAGAASRLVDMGIEPFLISSTLNVVIAQRLLRRLHDNKEGYFLTDVDIENLKKHCDIDRLINLFRKNEIIEDGKELQDIEFFRPRETEEVPDGYKGRIGAYEVLVVTDRVKELILKKVEAGKIRKEAQKQGMITMLEDGLTKAAGGITSIEEVLRVLTE